MRRGKDKWKHFWIDKHTIVQYCCCLLSILLIPVAYGLIANNSLNTGIGDVKVASLDKNMTVKYDVFGGTSADKIRISVRDSEGVLVDEILAPAKSGKAVFESGEYGKYYSFTISFENQGNVKETKECGGLFLDYDKLPGLQTFYVKTLSGNDPTYTVYEKPNEDTKGKTIKDNEYEEAVLWASGLNEQINGDSVEIKVRGNGSTLQEKNAYRIRFSNKVSLLENDETECQEWVLLNNADSLNTYIANYIGELCGMDWVMPFVFCNVILNDDYKGTYYLAPNVSIDASNGRISKFGYLFENDAYWWSKGDLYFKTGYNVDKDYFGWTIKYPEIVSVDSQECQYLRNYLLEIESILYAEKVDDRWEDYIDSESFASWLLSKDVIGLSDSAGSNMYYYIKDYDINNPTASKVMMGPLWDFDSSFTKYGKWSSHNAPYFKQLFEIDQFRQLYTEKWKGVEAGLIQNVESFTESFKDEYGSSIQDSWNLENARYNRAIPSVDEQCNAAIGWLYDRVPWLNNKLGLQ